MLEPSGRLILYADDNPDDVVMFEEAVGESCPDCRVRSCADGQALLDMLKELDRKKQLSDVAIIVLDVMMPKKDGIQVLFDLKINPQYRPIPVIMWSGAEREQDKLRAYAMGCNTYVVKPASYTALVEKVQGLISYWLNLASLPNLIPQNK